MVSFFSLMRRFWPPLLLFSFFIRCNLYGLTHYSIILVISAYTLWLRLLPSRQTSRRRRLQWPKLQSMDVQNSGETKGEPGSSQNRSTPTHSECPHPLKYKVYRRTSLEQGIPAYVPRIFKHPQITAGARFPYNPIRLLCVHYSLFS